MQILIVSDWRSPEPEWRELSHILSGMGYAVTFAEYPTLLTPDIDDAVEFVEHHYTQETILLGHGLGGRIAVQSSVRGNHHITATILMSTPSLNHTFWFFRILRFFKRRLLSLAFFVPKKIKKFIGDYILSIVRKRTKPEQVYYKIIADEQESLLAVLKTPVLLLWGQNDKVVAPAIAKKMHHIIENCDILFVSEENEKMHMHKPALIAETIHTYAQSQH